MKKLSRRWRRFVIISLLALSVLAPILLLSNRLKILTSDGWNEFVEDLNRFEAEEESRDSPWDIYQEHGSNLVDNYSNQLLGPGKPISVEGSATLVGKNGTNKDKRENQQRLSASAGKARAVVVIEQGLGDRRGHRYIQEKSNLTSLHHHHGQRLWYQSPKSTNEIVMKMKDQLTRAKMYLQFSPPNSSSQHAKELRQRIRDMERAMGKATRDSQLSRSARQKIRSMESALEKASRIHTDCSTITAKLQAMAYSSEERIRAHMNQVARHQFQLSSRTIPKGLHCLSMQLTTKYFELDPEARNLPNQQKFLDPKLHHVVVLSDNILACAVVVNSTVSSTMEPERVVFHVVTDSMNLPAISMWFLLNPPGESSIQIQSMDSFKGSPYDRNSRLKKQSYHHLRYISLLDQICIYLPDIFPVLNKIVLLDHDVVVQKDLEGLWGVNMKGKVIGAVETCQEEESLVLQMDKLIKLLNPKTRKGVGVNACIWAPGMNVFDLQMWRRKNLTAAYHKYLHTLPGLREFEREFLLWAMFYDHVLGLDPRWHTRGLGRDLGVEARDIEKAAVIHYDGAMKPWLDIGVRRFKGYWSKFLDYNHPVLQQCNIHQ